MSKIILPRQENGEYYLSYSQLALWKKSKRDYIRRYFFGEKDDNATLKKYADFGSMVGEALETGDFSAFTEEETEFLKTVPRYDEFEREIKLDLGGFFTKGYIDTNTLVYRKKGSDKVPVVEKLADYKTGEISKREADYASEDYLQTDIYAAAVWKELGYLPKDVSVILIQRDGNAFAGEDLTLGREWVKIKRKCNKTTCSHAITEFKKVAKEISDYYKIFLSLNK